MGDTRNLPVTSYYSHDAGAPQISSATPQEVIAVLRKCLVDGYGDKAGAGWVVAFEDAVNNAIAFRNSTADGSGGYVKVYSQSVGNPFSYLRINTAVNMLDMDTFVNPTGYRQYTLNKNDNSNNANANNWEIHATTRGFWLFIHCFYYGDPSFALGSQAMLYQNNIFVGDLDCATPNDAGQFTLISANSTNGDSASSFAGSLVGGGATWYYNLYPTDSSNNTRSQYVSQRYSIATSTALSGTSSTIGIPNLLTPKLVHVADTSGGRSVTVPKVRGVVPGVYDGSFHGYSNSVVPFVELIDGRQFTPIRGNLAPTVWVDLEEWYV
ncbi:hypothetical protein H5125_05045 [Shewanella sp. SR44-4]|uniref:hypothetical protein n=1 Tax=Shewanella sp. SR44-4 TaxID=2760935 RepID=UPI0016003EFF|nr:hypothetical protein [Shewanella sp. SR44-4]MBB1361522.1 hypothetical protein [Shewanella sp. SR44-4]